MGITSAYKMEGKKVATFLLAFCTCFCCYTYTFYFNIGTTILAFTIVALYIQLDSRLLPGVEHAVCKLARSLAPSKTSDTAQVCIRLYVVVALFFTLCSTEYTPASYLLLSAMHAAFQSSHDYSYVCTYAYARVWALYELL